MIQRPGRFAYEFQYRDYLYSMYETGALRSQTVDDDQVRRGILADILSATPQEGLYLEVGQNAEPYCVGSSREFSPGASRYLGIDGGHSRYLDQGPNDDPIGWTHYGRSNAAADMNTAARAIAGNMPEGTGAVVWGDGAKLPLQNAEQQQHNPVRETFMRDVVEQPMMHPNSVEAIFTEQARVLGKAGRLIIRETYSPAYSGLDRYGEMSTQHLNVLASLEHSGFTERVFVTDDEMVAAALKHHFPGGAENLDTRGYYLICQQGEKPAEPTRAERIKAGLRRLAFGK